MKNIFTVKGGQLICFFSQVRTVLVDLQRITQLNSDSESQIHVLGTHQTDPDHPRVHW